MEGKPCLHDGIATIDLDKNRLVEISRRHQMTLTRIQSVYLKRNHHKQKEHNMQLHWTTNACTMARSEPIDLKIALC